MRHKSILRDVASHLPAISLPRISTLTRFSSGSKELITLYSLNEPWEEPGELFLARRTHRSRLDIGPIPHLPDSELMKLVPSSSEWFMCEAKDIQNHGWQMLDREIGHTQAMQSVRRQFDCSKFTALTQSHAGLLGPSMLCICGLKNFGKDYALDYAESNISGCRRLPLLTTRLPRSEEEPIELKSRSCENGKHRHLFLTDTPSFSSSERFKLYIKTRVLLAWRYREHVGTYYGLDYLLAEVLRSTFPNSLLLTSSGLRLSRMIQLQFASRSIPRSKVPKTIYGQAINPELALEWQRGRDDSEDETSLRQRHLLHDGLAHRWVDYVIWLSDRSDFTYGVAALIENIKRQS